MNIRPATEDDIEAIISLRETMHGAPIDHEAMNSSIRAIVANGEQEILLLVDNDGVVAQALVSLLYKFPKREVRIDEIVVASDKRGRGYGAAILAACEKWAAARDADVIEFTSRPSRESANAMYLKHGYRVRDTNVYQKQRGEF